MGPFVRRAFIQSTTALTITTSAGFVEPIKYMGPIAYRAMAKQCQTRDMDKVDGIVIHHDAITERPRDYHEMVEFIEKIAAEHEDRFGCGPSYHYYIWPDGEEWMLNPPEALTSHTQGANSRNVSICLSGNRHVSEVPLAQKNAVERRARELQGQYPNITRILPHRSYKATLCPGDKAVEALGGLWTIGE